MELGSRKSICLLFTLALFALFILPSHSQRFQRQQRFRQNNNNNNFRQNNNNNNNNFRGRNNNNNNGGGGGQNGFAFGLDTSDGRYARFDGPVRGLPPGHGGGRFGAADCLLCGK